jgi:hypothetical protein
MLPNRIFLTGVPGSRWSGIAQTLETIPGFNTTDRTPGRTYSHHSYTGHQGAYFGPGMELECRLCADYIDSAWTELSGTRVVKSHDWAYVLPQVAHYFPDDWIMLVYRPDMASYAWWHEAGGFQIKYPCYDAYIDSTSMLAAITKQNQCILEYAHSRNASWHHFTPEWVESAFGHKVEIKKTFPDILVTVFK